MKLIIGKAVNAAVVLICHFMLAALLVLTGHGIEWLVDYTGGLSSEDPLHGPKLIFDLVPLRYLFQAIDVAMIALFGYMGLREAYGGTEVSARPDWRGPWPRMVPEHFGQWLLHRLAIYTAVALGVAVAFLLVAASLRGHAFPAWVFGAGCVAYFAGRDLRLIRHHR